MQELFFHLIELLGVRLGVSPVGMVELFVHTTTKRHFLKKEMLADKIIFTCNLLRQNCFVQ